MTTPAITALLNEYREILRSRELTFDEKVGYLTAIIPESTERAIALLHTTLAQRAALIRAAMIKDQNQRMRELISAQAANEAARRAAPAKPAAPPRDLTREIQTEKDKLAKAAQRLSATDQQASPGVYARMFENLQLHINRLNSLERKQKQ